VSHNRRVVTIVVAIRVYGDPIMRATVGPLPSAVYWRRRAVVLGAVLLGIIVLFVSCSGNDKNDQRGKGGAPSSYPTPAPGDSGSPDPGESFLDGSANGGPSLPAPGDIQTTGSGTGTGDDGDTSTTAPGLPGLPTSAPAVGTGSNTNVTAPAGGSCTDAEMAVVPIPAKTTLNRGDAVEIRFKIKNKGTRTCSRDVGAGAQELYLDKGAQQYWSSDTCNPAKDVDVRQFGPGVETEYRVTWNGRQSNTCAGLSASGINPPPGQFELRARLGSLTSSPVELTIVG
jgi:hypothetical protein